MCLPLWYPAISLFKSSRLTSIKNPLPVFLRPIHEETTAPLTPLTQQSETFKICLVKRRTRNVTFNLQHAARQNYYQVRAFSVSLFDPSSTALLLSSFRLCFPLHYIPSPLHPIAPHLNLSSNHSLSSPTLWLHSVGALMNCIVPSSITYYILTGQGA